MIAERPHLNRRHLMTGFAALGLSSPLGACQTTGNKEEILVDGLRRLPMTQDVLNRFVSQSRLPGLCVGVQLPEGGKTFLRAGTLDFGSYERVDSHSLFRIYSMTKLITGAAAALLIEQGKLSLDQPIDEIFPAFSSPEVLVRKDGRRLVTEPAKSPITIRHLLTHTAGFMGNTSNGSPLEPLYTERGLKLTDRASQRPDTLAQMVERLAQVPLQTQPGTKYEYGPSIDVLGAVIEKVSGTSLPDYIQDHILGPLGMNDTVWQLSEENAHRLAALYSYANNRRTPVATASADVLMRPVSLYLGGSGLLSSASDYLEFLSMLLADGQAGRRRILKPETARLMRSDILPQGLEANGGGHGFGGWVAREGHKRAGEFGWSGNASTQAWIDPAHNFAAVLMMQALPYRSIDVLTPLRAALDADLGIPRPA